MTAGYSDTPLAKKLGLKSETHVWFDAMPASVCDEIELHGGLIEEAEAIPGLDAANVFVTERAELARWLADLRDLIRPAGQIRVSWPKKAAEMPTDIALPIGLVDVKVCAVDAIWSGLTLVIRRELR